MIEQDKDRTQNQYGAQDNSQNETQTKTQEQTQDPAQDQDAQIKLMLKNLGLLPDPNATAKDNLINQLRSLTAMSVQGVYQVYVPNPRDPLYMVSTEATKRIFNEPKNPTGFDSLALSATAIAIYKGLEYILRKK